MKKIFLIIIFLSLAENSFGQKIKDEKVKVDSLITLSKSNYGISTTKMLEYAQEALSLSQKINYKKGIAESFKFQGTGNYLLGNFKNAENYYSKALIVNEEIDNKVGIMSCLSNLGSVNNVQNKYAVALQYYQKAIRIGEIIKEDKNTANTYVNMGIIYSELKNYDLALYYFQKGLDIQTKINYGPGIAAGFANIGNVYFKTKDYNKALNFYQKALDKDKDNNNKLGIAVAYGNIATIYNELKQYDRAVENYNKSLEINQELKNKKGIAVNLNGIGACYLVQNKLSEAQDYSKRANSLSKLINLQDIERDSYENLSNIFEKTNKMDSAYSYYKKYIEIKDNIDNENNRKQISKLEIQYEFDHKEEKYKNDQLLSNEKLNQQQLLTVLNQLKLKESNREKDLVRLRFLKSQSELKTEQIAKKVQKKQLNLIQKDNLLKLNQLKINRLELKNREKQKWFYIIGLGFFAIIGGLLFNQSRNRKRANQKLKLLNMELDQANKVKTRFFSILNHDLRSPVSNLIHFLHLQKDSPELLDEETKNRMQDKTILGAENLLSSMEDILLWSKGQMENFKPHPKSITINQLFEDTQKVFSGYLKVKFEYHNPNNIIIFTDENYLKTIVRNLTSNAINTFVTTQNPYIIWKAWQENNQSFLSITDNGPGSEKEQFKALYDDKEVVGIKSGLGLHLIRDLAKSIDCEIIVNSEIGVGTTFILKFQIKI
ncbi:tetratricopeptide repeat protein [Flavobacterium sp.]|uniref:tetratricopeptide repeat protein n=1 Tax=Flavobacterium sp. TaxID=239 RepID=UPI0038FC1B72